LVFVESPELKPPDIVMDAQLQALYEQSSQLASSTPLPVEEDDEL
jgi:hypothetical protein